VLLWLSDVDLLIILWHSRFQCNGVIKTSILTRPSIFPPSPIVMSRIPQGSDCFKCTLSWLYLNMKAFQFFKKLPLNQPPDQQWTQEGNMAALYQSAWRTVINHGVLVLYTFPRSACYHINLHTLGSDHQNFPKISHWDRSPIRVKIRYRGIIHLVGGKSHGIESLF
jgi:hypothetical protein